MGLKMGGDARLRIAVLGGLLAGWALSPKLWMSSRLYPLTPVLAWLRPLPAPADAIVFFALMAAAMTAMFLPRKPVFAILFALLLLIAIEDQSRWQPWFYQYSMMLVAIALAGPKRQEFARRTCALIVAATYFWSGLAKLNPRFLGDTFPWLAASALRAWPGAQRIVRHAGLAAALLECAIGAGLLMPRFRRAAVAAAIAMHLFILAALGPSGRSFNFVVWPWNLAMIAFLLILFGDRATPPREMLWGRGFAFQKVALALFGLAPALSFFNLWDHYLSSALYSGNRNTGLIYLSDAVFDRLPDKIQDYVTEGGPSRNELDIFDWSLGELNVPSYPETRIYKNVAREICRYSGDDPDVELVIEEKLTLAGSRRLSYRCPDLR